jgi:hypothetical protein
MARVNRDGPGDDPEAHPENMKKAGSRASAHNQRQNSIGLF